MRWWFILITASVWVGFGLMIGSFMAIRVDQALTRLLDGNPESESDFSRILYRSDNPP
jgi:hypothetical protein